MSIVIRLALAALVLALAPGRAWAQGTTSSRVENDQSSTEELDTTYGRIEGDLGLVLGAGVTVGTGGPRAALDARVRYLDSAGLFVGYEEGALFTASADPRRILAFGMELRPLFLARWVKGWHWGKALPDLVVDSLGLELGAAFDEPRGEPFVSRPALQGGIGLEVPLLARVNGPWLSFHGGLRWGQEALAADQTSGRQDRSFFLTITLALHRIVGAHVVDAGDEAPR